MDLLPGFSEYFRTLTSHLRAQIWGFTLPYSRRRKAGDPQALHAACAQELARLTLRLDQGLDTRLQEEYDLKAASGCIPSRVSSPPSASRCWRLLNRSSSIQNSMPRN
ncbi:putative inner membrane protein [Salmonella enterica subsp. enterica]|nr:putative inner membrane protein [Salmonella enterica subsp. enterica] [Salmonella enterica subsp. enterica serovar Menston]